MKINTKNFVPLFNIEECGLLTTDLFSKTTYGKWGMIWTVKKGSRRDYLTNEIMDKLSKKLYCAALNKQFYKNYEKQAEKVIGEFEELNNTNIKDLEKKETINLLNKLVKFTIKFFNLYNQTEFFCFTKIENELKEHVKKTHKENENQILQNLLTDAPLNNLPLKIKQLVLFTRNIQHLRLKLRRVINKIFIIPGFYYDLMNEVNKFTDKDMNLFRLDELNLLLKGKKIKIPEREPFAIYKDELIFGYEAEKLIQELERKENLEELKGTIACTGKTKGKVHIILLTLDPSEAIKQMKKGDILVSPTTGPEMMAAIQKASAIITDEGGLMSHAAVISRELKIPCIVGTKFATKILKEGDLVEVDADKGIIRKIN